MSSPVYPINKGINRPLEFKGLKAQYIWYLGAGLLVLLVLAVHWPGVAQLPARLALRLVAAPDVQAWQREGRRPLTAREFLAGHRLVPGDCCPARP